MKVLHLTKSSLAEAPIRLHHFLKKSGVDSRCIQFKKGSMEVEPDILWQKKEDLFQLEDMLDWADIVHIHNQPPLENNTESWKVLQKYSKKKFVYQVHGEPDKVINKMYSTVIRWVDINEVLCIAQYQAVFLPQYLKRPFSVVRNIIDITDPLLQYKNVQNEKPLVTFSPSNKASLGRLKKKRGSTWAYKSYSEVKLILEELEKEDIINFEVYNNMPFRQTLEERLKGNVHIDDIYTGSYHLSSLEGLAQGKVVVCNLKNWMVKFLTNFLHCPEVELPWVVANARTLKKVIKNLCSDVSSLKNKQHYSRLWMEKHWSNEKVLNDYIKVYNRVLKER
jgi:hypothetical protein